MAAIAVGADDAGAPLKEHLADVAAEVAEAVARGEHARALLVCGTAPKVEKMKAVDARHRGRMDDGRIRAALRDATDTREVLIGPGALGATAEVLGRGAGDRPAVVVADGTTWRVAGERVQRRLEAAGRATVTPTGSQAPSCTPSTATWSGSGTPWPPTTPSRWRSARGRSTTSSSGPPTSSGGPI